MTMWERDKVTIIKMFKQMTDTIEEIHQEIINIRDDNKKHMENLSSQIDNLWDE